MAPSKEHIPKPALVKNNPLWRAVRAAHKRGRFISFPLYSMGEVAEGVPPKEAIASARHLADAAITGRKNYKTKIVIPPMVLTKAAQTMVDLHKHQNPGADPNLTVEVFAGHPREAPSFAPGQHPIDVIGSDRLPEIPKTLKGTAAEHQINSQKILKKELPPGVIRLAYVDGSYTGTINHGDPLEVYTAMRSERGYEDAMEKFTHWLERSEALNQLDAKELLKAGAHGIVILDPAASAVSPEDFRNHVLPAAQRLVQVIHENGGFSIYHVCGDASRIIYEMCKTGASGLQVEVPGKLKEALKDVDRFNKDHPKRPPTMLIGNFDQRMVTGMGEGLNLNYWTQDEVAKRTKEMLDIGKDYPFYVPGTGCEVPPNVPKESVYTHTDTIHKYKRR